MKDNISIMDHIRMLEEKITNMEKTLEQIRTSSQVSAQLLLYLLKSRLQDDEETHKDLIRQNEATLPIILEKMSDFIEELASCSKTEKDQLSDEMRTVTLDQDPTVALESMKVDEPPPIPSKYSFSKQEINHDKWNFIANLQETFDSYKHLTHLLIPKFFQNIVTELHHYNNPVDEFLYDCIQYPAEKLRTISTKLIKEAPSSQILQRLYNKRIAEKNDIIEEYKLNADEMAFIQKMVENYYHKLRRNFESDFEDLRYLRIRLQKAVDNFSLGTANIETRIILVIYNMIKLIWKEIEQDIQENGDKRNLMIKMSTLDLIISSAKFLTQSKRFKELLIEIKY